MAISTEGRDKDILLFEVGKHSPFYLYKESHLCGKKRYFWKDLVNLINATYGLIQHNCLIDTLLSSCLQEYWLFPLVFKSFVVVRDLQGKQLHTGHKIYTITHHPKR